MKQSSHWLLRLGILLLVVVVAVTVLQVAFHLFLRSDRFRELLSEKTGAALGVEGEFAPLRWEGASAYTEQFHAKGQDNTRLEKLQAENIRAYFNWRAIFSGAWRMERLDIARLLLVPKVTSESTTESPPTLTKSSSSLPSWLPQRFEWGEIAVEDARIESPSGASLKQSSWIITPFGDGWQVYAKRGELNLGMIPKLNLETANIRYQQGIWYLTDTTLRDSGDGVINATGEWKSDSQLAIQLNWHQLDFKKWVPKKWHKYLEGIVEGSATVKGPVQNPDLWHITGDFLLTEGRLKNVELMDQIAFFTQAPQFKRMTITSISGEFTWEDHTLTVTNFVLESRGVFRMEGNFTVTPNGQIQGDFQTGVTSQSLQWIPGSRERVFTTMRNGYLWAPMKVTGNIDSINEDLSARLIAALPAELIDKSGDIIRKAPESLQEATQKALNLLFQ